MARENFNVAMPLGSRDIWGCKRGVEAVRYFGVQKGSEGRDLEQRRRHVRELFDDPGDAGFAFGVWGFGF